MWTAWDMLQELRAADHSQFTDEQRSLFAFLQDIRRPWLPEERRMVIGAWHTLRGLAVPALDEVVPEPLLMPFSPSRLPKRRGHWGKRLEAEITHVG